MRLVFQEFRDNFARIEVRFDALDKRIHGMEKRFERYFELIYSEITGLKTRLTLVESTGERPDRN